MPAPPVKTRTPGVYKRGSRYVIRYRNLGGKPQWESCGTYDEARRLKKARDTDVRRGEFEERGRISLHQYLLDHVQQYRGTGRRGYRPETRDDDQRLLERYAIQYFPASMRLQDVGPADIDGFIGWLMRQPSSRGGTLSDSSIRNILKPLRAALQTARRTGLIRTNPAADAVLPHRARVEEDDDGPRPFPYGVMELVVSLIDPRYRLMYELLAATGVRRSELLAFEVRDLTLDGGAPKVAVRRRVRRQKGNGLVVGPLKSKTANRAIPIPLELAERIRTHVAGRDPRELVFTTTVGTILDPDNLADRVLAPACAAAEAEWAGHHTFRHTVASRMFADGRNLKQIQRWLGHHSAEFTLKTYIKLINEDDLGGPLQVDPIEGAHGSAHMTHGIQRD